MTENMHAKYERVTSGVRKIPDKGRMEARIKELEAALSSAQADREALMELIPPIKLIQQYSHEAATVRECRAAINRLPAHLRYEAEGKATP